MRQTRSLFARFPGGAILIMTMLAAGCREEAVVDRRIKTMDPAEAARLARSIEATVTPQLADGLSLRLWGVDSLVADPIAIDIDDMGKLYYTRTNRQKHSEFDIRGHQDWEIPSISLQTVEDKRAFLRRVLSPENSDRNQWLADLNGDGSHDWKDMTVETEHVYRIEDADADGVADLSQLVVDDFHTEITDVAGGVLINGKDLFVGVGPDLWRLRDRNGDGVADEKQSISHGYGVHIGFGGHGMSGIEMGPEGRIYWQIGDIGFNGTGPDGKKWEHPNSGVIVRSEPDGSDFEVFAYGNRNTHEFVFDEYGNLISEDNDGDHQGEKERIVYIVNGSDTGWRTNWQFGKYRDPDNNGYKVWMDEKMYLPRFEGQAAYITPAVANFVSGPSGMLYNPGTALGPRWRNTFFIAEFVGNPSRSGIHAFRLKPKGASFELGEHEMILSGVLATGIDFGPDGAMYIADWIQGWDTKDHGRIWKLDVTDSTAQAEKAGTQRLLADDFSAYGEARLGQLLAHADMRVRQKSQFELCGRGDAGLEIFKENLGQREHQLARVHAIWGISQLARKKDSHARLLIPFLRDEDPEIRAQAAKWLGDVRCRDAGDALIPLLKDDYSRARFFAAEALGRIAHAPAIAPIIELLRAEDDRDAFIRHAGSLALARIGVPDPVVALAEDGSQAVRIAAVVALRRMRHPGIAAFLNDNNEFIVTEAARAINDDLSIVPALPALGDLLDKTRFTGEALLRRAISANLRTGTEKAMRNLIGYSQNENAPTAMRVEALAALSTWAKPSVVDRVDGRYRGVVTRDPKIVGAAAAPVLTALADHREPGIRMQAVKAIGKMKLASGEDKLLAKLKTDPRADIRVEALRSLALFDSQKIDQAIRQALSDTQKEVRIAGLDLLAKMEIPDQLKVTLLAEAIDKRTIEEKQAALLALGQVSPELSQPVLSELLNRMSRGKLPAEIYLELSEAIDSTRSEELKTRYRRISAAMSEDSLSASYKGALAGGDAGRGRSIFFRHQTAQCIRCHSFDDFGGSAGPRLNGIAAKLTKEQLLESLIDPGARIAPGFGTVTLELGNGKKVSGILQSEKNAELVLKVGDKPDTVIRKGDVVKQTTGGSSMPPMHLLLSRREIRDLVSFLVTLKED